MTSTVKTWRAVFLMATASAGPALVMVGAGGCTKTPLERSPAVCKYPTSCLMLDAAPPQIDSTKPIPVQDCIAAAARTVLTIEQQVGMLGQTSATDPTVRAVGQQMAEDFAAALANLDQVSPGLGINPAFDCSDKEQAAGLVQPALTQLQALHGAAFDAQFLSLEAATLQQVLDFYNEELIGNANSGVFKTSLQYERWRFTGDAGVPVVKLFAPDASCPSPAVAPTGAGQTCLGVVPEMMTVQALSVSLGGSPDGGLSDGGTMDAGGG
jgi:hypothetical protein